MQQLRCQCTNRPMLGLVGRNEVTGKPFVHVKIFKQGRVFGEFVIEDGTVRMRCRECARWTAVRVGVAKIDVKQQPLPESYKLVT